MFVVKQKTAYKMCISDWSSDVCSSDLSLRELIPPAPRSHEGQLLSRFVGSHVQCSHRCATWHTLVRHDRARFEPREQVRHSAPAIGIEPSTTPIDRKSTRLNSSH